MADSIKLAGTSRAKQNLPLLPADLLVDDCTIVSQVRLLVFLADQLSDKCTMDSQLRLPVLLAHLLSDECW